MNPILKEDLQTINKLLSDTLVQGLTYLSKLDETPTSVDLISPTEKNLSSVGVGGQEALKEFIDRFESFMVASSGPRYWGFVTGGSTPAALMGDLLATIYDQNTQTTKGHGDVSAIVEFETIRLLLELFGLPDDFMGGFVTGATMSNFTCLGAARQWVGKRQGYDIARSGLTEPIHILSAVPHSSSIKALSMLGIGSRQVTKIPTLGPTREAIDMSQLEEAILRLNGEPFILISSGGTVNTVDFDDMKAISALKEKHHFWWHIDAAFGGFAAISPKYKHLLEGWERADSITIDGHKWLNVPYESAFFFTRKEHTLLQIETFQNSNAPYLGDPNENFNYLNFLPENSRRFKALAAWFTLRAYGKDGYQEIVERTVNLAQEFGQFITDSAAFELLAPTRLNTVCFTLTNGSEKDVNAFLSQLNDRGKIFMTPTFFNGRAGIRAALVNWRTTTEDVQIVKEEMNQVVQNLQSSAR
ncbi:pyridoxal phosphate-dependent decarboxylase family protein [Marinoscillum sp.]|uniref:pyridoxal phosphate-dependent decarboxylase family protein n=1 Tax=Marinoscillum sp. TaxID=2024838 RepID=UPI003BABDDEC